MAERSGGSGAHTCFSSGGEHDLGSGLRRALRALVARAAACGHSRRSRCRS